jgi:carboxylate-amine ligase
MSDKCPLHLFEGFGVELEYMIVDAETLSVSPITDKVLHAVAGEYLSEIELGDISWSNELVLHVIELKTTGPAASLDPLPQQFQEHVQRINKLLDPLGARLMPSAMHPWMDPAREMQLWPHDYSPVYDSFNRIFDCRGHGWANLQSVHLNLPFADDQEFARLHAAIRLLLPILPAIAASSPVMEGRLTGLLDTRLDVYRNNARRVPSVCGHVIPEPVYSRAAYEREILQRIYADLAPLDPEGILQFEWANARGAIARFDRNAIEIRVLDVQECPLADVAICVAIVEVLRALVSQRWTDLNQQQSFAIEPLAKILQATIRDADQAVIDNADFLRQFGFPSSGRTTAQELWQHLCAQTITSSPELTQWHQPVQEIIDNGPLARRITNSLKADVSRERLSSLYRELCDCLAEGRMFTGCTPVRGRSESVGK